MCSFLSIFSALSFLFIKYLSGKTNILSKSLIIILIFSISDWVKGNILWGFPWTPISAIWTFNETVMIPFSYLGVWGYSLITYVLIVSIYTIKKSLKVGIYIFVPLILSLLTCYLYPKKNERFAENFNVRLIQPNIKQDDKWDTGKTQENLNNLINLSLNNITEDIDLVIWPETAVSFDIEGDSKNKLLLKNKFEKVSNFILGAIRIEQLVNKSKIYNSIFFITKEFSSFTHHDKIKLVPFGEFIPFRSLLDRKNMTLGGMDFSKGNQLGLFKFNDKIKILPLICYEVIFPKITKNKKNDYNLIVNITNDAWFGSSIGPYQHLALSKVRAVIEGKFILRVANTGITAIIDNNGKLLDKIGLNQTGVIEKKLVLYKNNTLYNYLGDGIFFILLIILILMIAKFKKGLKGKYE